MIHDCGGSLLESNGGGSRSSAPEPLAGVVLERIAPDTQKSKRADR